MNISITNECNRRCAYCFQKDWYLSKKAGLPDDETVKEMPVSEFAALCDWAPKVKVMKVLGGEPLMHSRLTEMMDTAIAKGKQMAFISNISVEAEAFDRFAEYCRREGFIKSVLINTDYPKKQEGIFKRNLEVLCRTQTELSFSTTLLPGEKAIADSQKRIAECADVYRSARGSIEGFRVRLAPFCPNPTNSTGFQIYDFTDDIISFVNGLAPTGIEEYGFDCPVNLCELRSDFIDAARNMQFTVRTRQCSPETGMPFDILVDHSVIWCSSANFLRLNDWRDYPNFDTAKHELSKQYYAWWRSHGYGEKCRSCGKLNPGLCSGFCIAKSQNLRRIPIRSVNTEIEAGKHAL